MLSHSITREKAAGLLFMVCAHTTQGSCHVHDLSQARFTMSLIFWTVFDPLFDLIQLSFYTCYVFLYRFIQSILVRVSPGHLPTTYSYHLGGSKIILKYAGKDATYATKLSEPFHSQAYAAQSGIRTHTSSKRHH